VTARYNTVSDQISGDWGAFKTAFTAHHQPVNTTFRAQAQIRDTIARAQRGQFSTVHEFYVELSTHWESIKNPGVTDGEKGRNRARGL
jgi:hypothetical protein